MNHHPSDPTSAPSRRAIKPFAPLQSSERGAALIIVLAFVVMLLVLLLAFFSRSTQQQQISKSSSTIDLTDIFAQGAVSTIIGNLKQEIVDGSTTNTNTTTNTLIGVVTNMVYYPATNPNGVAMNMVPQLMGCATSTITSNNPAGQLPNLVKISTNLPFYTITNSQGSTVSGMNIATTNSTTNASFNGRSVSAARWNEALLLPLLNPSDTNTYTPVASFVPPSWILVARNGSNPTTGSFTSGSTDMRWNTTNPTTVIGRYAYAIYNEGGLLDANVAGFPPALTNFPLPNAVNTNLYPAYKEGSYFSDLTQIGMTPAQIIALVGWRNAASSSNTGTFPQYQNTTVIGTNYATAVLGNTNGFLRVATNTMSNNFGVVTDRQFTSRQQLITFLINADTNGVQNALTALQSLGTFSRSLEQPSYQPATNRPLVVTGPSPDYAANGGNNGSGLDNQINPSFLTLRVTNSFLRTNASTVTITNPAVVGEPLIKQRFALNRLAWITYKGPSAKLFSVGTTNTTDPEMLYYISNGISASFLTNGTSNNIATYFGLTWSNNQTSATGGAWYYNVHNGSANGVANPAGNNNQGPINRLSAVAALPAGQGREPDFFELLKGTQDVGAIAKGSIAGATAAGTGAGAGYIPLNWQYKLDTSVDYAVIQLGANIIDQFDPDSFPTRIRFDDGSGGTNVFLKEFRGVEDLPYLYRVHYGGWVGKDATPGYLATNFGTTPPQTNGPSTTQVHAILATSSGKLYNTLLPGSLIDPGVGVMLGLPDVWNPHSPSITTVPSTLQPTVLRVTAESRTPDDILNSTYLSQQAIWIGSMADSSLGARVQGYGSYPTNFANPGPAEVSHVATTYTQTYSSNPAIGSGSTFFPAAPPFVSKTYGYANFKTITTNTSSVRFPYANNLYREPTLLAEYGKPTVGGAGPTAMYSADVGLTNLTTGTNNVGGTKIFSGGPTTGGYLANPATVSFYGLPNSLNKGGGDSGNYVGILIGFYPLRWVLTPRTSGMGGGNTGQILAQVVGCYTLGIDHQAATTNSVPIPNIALTYLLQYQDPNNPNNWITYDEKYSDINAGWNTPTGLLQNAVIPCVTTYTDPRTSRFGAPNVSGGGVYLNNATIPMNMSVNNLNPAWLDPTNNVMWSERPDFNIGTSYSMRAGSPSVASGWTLWAAPGWHLSALGTANCYYQPALLSQNNPYFPNQGILATNTGAPSVGVKDPVFYGDPDGVVRRAMGGYNTNANNPGYNGNAPSLGLPMAVANSISGGTATPLPSGQLASRPVMLNRPFRSVAELGYVFSGRPWRNIDFFTPESGESPFLDVFCINPPVSSTGMSAGKVNLNTRQTNVLAALLSGGYRDETNPVTTNASLNSTINSNDATSMAAQIIAYTATNPLANMADLVGRFKATNQITGAFSPGLSSSFNTDGSRSYTGLSALFTDTNNFTNSLIQRFREAPIRALSAAGQTRVWNLLIDVVAQTGKYPPSATGADNFTVEGETRYWVHLAIDRLTGQVLDEQIEEVKE